MSEEFEFKHKQTVWAKVEGSPLWPAKIMKILNIGGKTVYKVNFYGDPSYCYLHPQSLMKFQDYHNQQIHEHEQNLKLKRALKLAYAAVYKNYHEQSQKNHELSPKPTQSTIQPLVFQQTISHPEKNSINLVILPQNQKKKQHQNNFALFCQNQTTLNLNEISPQNVLEILDCYRQGKLAEQLGKLQRKQIINFQNILKSNLLFKYNLHYVDQLKIKQNKIQNEQKPVLSHIEQLRALKRQKKAEKQSIKFSQKQHSMRRMQKCLLRKGMHQQASFTLTQRIVNQIEKRSKSMGKNSQTYFKQNIIRTIQQISQNMDDIQLLEMEYIEKNILSVLDLEFHHEIKVEEGSRMTQLHEEFCM